MLQTGQGKYLEKFRLRSIRPGHEKCVQPTGLRQHIYEFVIVCMVASRFCANSERMVEDIFKHLNNWNFPLQTVSAVKISCI
ncbi:hypothetical protein ABEB36_006071 [Hypothenemus hampei]|uniref:Uncharacterized protein n=1 Tax=Hypothenemus hampei TaxID=57062 RepID=A0ABD1F0E8_HYPHA